jgi:hypothetical protein
MIRLSLSYTQATLPDILSTVLFFALCPSNCFNGLDCPTASQQSNQRVRAFFIVSMGAIARQAVNHLVQLITGISELGQASCEL